MSLSLGVATGFLLNQMSPSPFIDQYIVGGLFHVVGKIFIASLKMLVVPLVFVSLVCGVIGLEDVKKLGSLGGKTLFLYITTTSLAIGFALGLALLIQPGDGFNLPTGVSFEAKDAPPLSEIIIGMVPTNPFRAAVEGNMLKIIVFALLFGVGLSLVKEQAKGLIKLFEELNQVIMKMVTLLMTLAPFGVFALIAKVFAQQGFGAFKPLLVYFFVVAGALFLHLFINYSLMLKLLTGLSPMVYLKKIRSTLLFAFSTASSNATLPVTMKAVQDKLGVPKSIASFTIPLGATINMDGTAIMQGVATVFISQAYNIHISPSGYLMVILTATLASIGTAGVPGVGLITLAMVLRQVGLPVEGIGLIIGVDRLLDMLRTALNVSGDCMISCVIAKWEGSLDSKSFHKKAAPDLS